MSGKRRCKSTGAAIADEPASSTINPTAAATFPLASLVQPGPKGAPGQTARMRNPAGTVASAG